ALLVHHAQAVLDIEEIVAVPHVSIAVLAHEGLTLASGAALEREVFPHRVEIALVEEMRMDVDLHAVTRKSNEPALRLAIRITSSGLKMPSCSLPGLLGK